MKAIAAAIGLPKLPPRQNILGAIAGMLDQSTL